MAGPTLRTRFVKYNIAQKNGASALGLQRVLGLGSYKTAWSWLHKLRRAMVRPGRAEVRPRPVAFALALDQTLNSTLHAVPPVPCFPLLLGIGVVRPERSYGF